MIARTQGDVQLPYWCRGGTGYFAPKQPGRGFWDAVSQTVPLRKACPVVPTRSGSQFPNGPPRGNCDPESALKLGCGFPSKPLPETVSHLEGQNWDAVSGPGIKTKLRWNSSCLGLQPAKTRTISPQLMRAGKMPALATKCHLRGLGGHSQRHVTEAHISYGIPSSTDKRCPAGLPSNEACHSLRRSARCRQSADTAK